MLVGREVQADLNIAIYRTTSIGDVVLASANLALLDALPIKVKVFWLGRKPALGLLASSYPNLICFEVMRTDSATVSKEQFASIDRLDFILDLQKNLRSKMVCSSLGRSFGARVFTRSKSSLQRSMLILKATFFGRSRAASPLIQKTDKYQFQAMLEPLLLALKKSDKSVDFSASALPSLPTSHDEGLRPWQKELRFGTWAAVAPGASFETKRAPQSLFVESLINLKRKLIENNASCGLVFLGDERDREVAVKVLDEIQWPFSTLNLAGKLSLWESALALSEAAVLLSNDSSLAHISEAVRTPAGIFFGPTVEAFGFGPRHDKSSAFSSLLGCRPCSKHGKTPCRYGDLLCFNSISPRKVGDYLFNQIQLETPL